jgi:hypothetical protein
MVVVIDVSVLKKGEHTCVKTGSCVVRAGVRWVEVVGDPAIHQDTDGDGEVGGGV